MGMFSRGGGKVEISESTYKVDTDIIDNYFETYDCDYIKMDIEGAEYKALLGAENIIKNSNTELAISLYHRQEDLIDIPILLKNFKPDYRFYLRLYSKFPMEMCLYALN